MAKTGSKNNFLKSVTKTSLDASILKNENQNSKTFKAYEGLLSHLTEQLKKGAAIGDPELSLRLERICINFDKLNFIQTQKETDRNEKQLTQSWAAEKAIEFLKTNPERYKQEINAILPGGMKNLPEGDAYITHIQAQIKSLGQIRYAMPTAIQKEMVSARQENLKAGEKGYKELQKKTLFPPPPDQNQKQSGHKSQGDEISATRADEIQRNQKFLLDSENKYDSALKFFLDAKNQEMRTEIMKIDKAVQSLDKTIETAKKKEPAVFGKKEWKESLQALQKQKDVLSKQKSEVLKSQEKMKDRLTEEFRKNNPEITKNRDFALKQRLERQVKQSREKRIEKVRTQGQTLSRRI